MGLVSTNCIQHRMATEQRLGNDYVLGCCRNLTRPSGRVATT